MSTPWDGIMGKINGLFGQTPEKPEARIDNVSQGTHLSNSNPPTDTVSSSVQKEIDGILEENNVSNLRYLALKIVKNNIGDDLSLVEIKDDHRGLYISVRIPGRYKNSDSIKKILLNELIRTKQIPIDSKSFMIGNIRVEFEDSAYFGQGGFNLYTNKKISQTETRGLQDFFERVFLSEYLPNSYNLLDPKKIRALLELSDKDHISLRSMCLEVVIRTENDIQITNELLDQLVMDLNNSYENYSLKHKKELSINDTTFSPNKVVIQEIGTGIKCHLTATCVNGKLTINIFPKDEKLKINKEFIETILKSIIFFLNQKNEGKNNPIKLLKDMGVIVYEKSEDEVKKALSDLYREEGFMGYEDIKSLLAANIIHPWEQKDLYTEAVNKEFPHIRNIIPNTALFEGPPGTGKTTQAKIIGKYLGYPFIYVPIGKLMSKWYGESESRLDKIFELAGKAAKEYGGIIVMIDEIDEIGGNREKSHEATARMTGVLLKKLDGIEKIGNLLLIGSTNRKESLDPALLSRFSRQVYFRLPDIYEIRHILSLYIPAASTLDENFLQKLVGKSGRDIKNLAEDIVRIYMQKGVILKEEATIEKVLVEYFEGLK